ncbi:MAG: crossover junction endodeoxyribonuclease RuvC [Candidatus Pacebacteria bacterium]|nr:crossover junction endodeoxyribonuclease RuvC [Candidatus Paceibacterota bacterium]
MKIIGIDPGYERLGIAVVEKTTQKELLLYSQCFQTDSKLPFHERLLLLGEELQSVITKHKPDHLALENIFFNTNQKTAMDVAAVRGVILYVARSKNVQTFEYTPPQIKAAVGGSGRASKKEVASMLHHLIDINKEIRYDDEYDAIAVALTHSAFCGYRF